ncbi:MAG: dihydrodipicolinate reductase [Deltaproteobacteria bacterium]|nr:dihydrodipicolinate reductase [Deltaproteobacteria bacterium]
MNPIRVMVNGLPGNMAATVACHVGSDNRFDLIPFSLTGADIPSSEFKLGDTLIRLLHPDNRDAAIGDIVKKYQGLIMVDYTHPSAVNANAMFYVRYHLPFVMGTTGGDRKNLENTVMSSATSAVIAPNMAKQIVGLQAMLEYAAANFPDLYKGYSLKVRESHQNGKADTSGTARAIIGYFNQMGIPFSEKDIQMERSSDVQRKTWGIPEAYIGGHGWHTYTLTSEDETVTFEFTHNVNGRDVYALGTLDAVVYLHGKIRQGIQGRVFSMIDVLQGA